MIKTPQPELVFEQPERPLVKRTALRFGADGMKKKTSPFKNEK